MLGDPFMRIEPLPAIAPEMTWEDAMVALHARDHRVAMHYVQAAALKGYSLEAALHIFGYQLAKARFHFNANLMLMARDTHLRSW